MSDEVTVMPVFESNEAWDGVCGGCERKNGRHSLDCPVAIAISSCRAVEELQQESKSYANIYGCRWHPVCVHLEAAIESKLAFDASGVYHGIQSLYLADIYAIVEFERAEHERRF